MRRILLALTVLCGLTGCAAPAAAAAHPKPAATGPLPNVVVPAPVSATGDGTTFTLPSSATVSSDTADVGTYLAGILRASTGYAIPVTAGSGTIALSLSGAPASVG